MRGEEGGRQDEDRDEGKRGKEGRSPAGLALLPVTAHILLPALISLPLSLPLHRQPVCISIQCSIPSGVYIAESQPSPPQSPWIDLHRPTCHPLTPTARLLTCQVRNHSSVTNFFLGFLISHLFAFRNVKAPCPMPTPALTLAHHLPLLKMLRSVTSTLFRPPTTSLPSPSHRSNMPRNSTPSPTSFSSLSSAPWHVLACRLSPSIPAPPS